MEFKLQLGSTPPSCPASLLSVAVPPLAVDDRHGLIRAGAALFTLAPGLPFNFQSSASNKTASASAAAAGSKQLGVPSPAGGLSAHSSLADTPLALGSESTACRRLTRRSGGNRRDRPTLRRSSAPAASVSVSVAGTSEAVAHKAVASAAALAQASSPQLQKLLAGGVAGAVSKTLVAPLERVSTMLMTDGHRVGFGPGEALAHAWREGGLAGLFRGNAATLAKIFPASALQFATFHFLKDALLRQRAVQRASPGGWASPQPAGNAGPSSRRQQHIHGSHPPQQQQRRNGQQQQQHQQHGCDELSNGEHLLAGAAAGAASVAFTYPLESARTLMSVSGGMQGSLLSVCQRVVASGGVRALYRGFQATLLGDVVGNALGFTFYEAFNRAFKDANGGVAAPPSVRGVIGALSAATALTVTMPLEVVRRRLQVQGTLGRPVLYRGTLDCFTRIASKEGLAGFYRSALPSYLKVAPSIGATYFLFELLTKHLDVPATPGASAEGAAQATGQAPSAVPNQSAAA